MIINWSAIGAAGEVAGAIAVVATLLYLARQIRQGNRIAQAEAFRSSQLTFADMLDSWVKDRHWAEVFVRIRYHGARRDDLTEGERVRAGFYLQMLLTRYSALHRDVQLGILPPEAYEIHSAAVLTAPYLNDVWPVLRQDHSADFVDFMEARFGLGAKAPRE